MAEDELEIFLWTENSTNICFEDEGSLFCGQKDRCMRAGMVLPIFNESTWSW